MKYVAPEHPDGMAHYYFSGPISELRVDAIKIQNLCESLLGMEQELFEVYLKNGKIKRL